MDSVWSDVCPDLRYYKTAQATLDIGIWFNRQDNVEANVFNLQVWKHLKKTMKDKFKSIFMTTTNGI
ncbi:hypothetical protein WN943_009888 [Citrus x changshan-huyou]